MDDVSDRQRLIGQIVSWLVGLYLLIDAGMLIFAPQLLAAEFQATGWRLASAPIIGLTALAASFLYLLPRTRMVGAILITGFVGGALATVARIYPGVNLHILFLAGIGLFAWVGLMLRDRSLRSLILAG
jgi:hypothetical protein